MLIRILTDCVRVFVCACVCAGWLDCERNYIFIYLLKLLKHRIASGDLAAYCALEKFAFALEIWL